MANCWHCRWRHGAYVYERPQYSGGDEVEVLGPETASYINGGLCLLPEWALPEAWTLDGHVPGVPFVPGVHTERRNDLALRG